MTRKRTTPSTPCAASRIPEFASYAEEAEWWDTHDLADYWDEFKPVTVTFAEKLSSSLIIDIDGATFDQLSRRAQEQGTDAASLARAWVLERLLHAG